MATETTQETGKKETTTEFSPEAKSRIEALEKENQSLLKDTMAKKEQIRDLEAKTENERQAQLKEQAKWKELYEVAQPTLARFKEIEPVLTSLLETELSEVPEDKRDIIPQFEKPEAKLLWLRQAKGKGFFKPAEEPKKEKDGKPVSTVQSKVNTDGTLPEFVSWAPSDPRLTSLSMAQFRLWKQHNQKQAPGVTGWGSAK